MLLSEYLLIPVVTRWEGNGKGGEEHKNRMKSRINKSVNNLHLWPWCCILFFTIKVGLNFVEFYSSMYALYLTNGDPVIGVTLTFIHKTVSSKTTTTTKKHVIMNKLCKMCEIIEEIIQIQLILKCYFILHFHNNWIYWIHFYFINVFYFKWPLFFILPFSPVTLLFHVIFQDSGVVTTFSPFSQLHTPRQS